MSRAREQVFVDTGAWIALALSRDPFHQRAKEVWELLMQRRIPLATSVPVVIETFTFLERNAAREVALAWRESLPKPVTLRILECSVRDMDRAWAYFRRKDLHKLSAVDATSFVLMTRERIRVAFAFDHHFASAGFRLTD